MALPEERFQPASQAPVPPGAPGVQQAGTSREPKDAFQDPTSEKFMVEFFSGIGSKKLVMAAPNKESANMAAFFVALKHFPEIHTFGVWRKTGPNADDLGECTCFVAMANILPFCSKELADLTGKRLVTPAVPVVTTDAGFEELGKQLKAQGGKK